MIFLSNPTIMLLALPLIFKLRVIFPLFLYSADQFQTFLILFLGFHSFFNHPSLIIHIFIIFPTCSQDPSFLFSFSSFFDCSYSSHFRTSKCPLFLVRPCSHRIWRKHFGTFSPWCGQFAHLCLLQANYTSKQKSGPQLGFCPNTYRTYTFFTVRFFLWGQTHLY